MSIIYKTTNQVNGKIYVGQHFTSADDGYLGSGKILKQAIRKYGKKNFVRETIDFCTSADIDEKETHWIDKLDATNPKVGYNISFGGNGIGKHSKETKIKISLSNKKPKTEEHRRKIQEQHEKYQKGKKLSEEHKRKISQSLKGHNYTSKERIEFLKNNRKGKKHSEETKKYFREIRKGTNRGENNPQNKWIYVISDGTNYWKLSKTERRSIKNKFNRQKKLEIGWKNLIIQRKLKNEI